MSDPIVTPSLLARMKPSLVPGLPDAAPLAPVIQMPAMPQLPSPFMAPAAHLAPPLSPVQKYQQAYDSKAQAGSGIDQVQNPLLRGLARAGDIVGSVFAPNIARAIPGTTLHHEYLMARDAEHVKEAQGEEQASANLEDTQGQTQERKALGDKAAALAEADTPFHINAAQASAAGDPALEGTVITPRDFGTLVRNHHTNDTKVTTTGMNNDTKLTTTGMTTDAAAAKDQADRDSHETLAGAANKTHLLIAQMHDATSRANNANTNDHKSTGTLAGGKDGQSFKVPAEVTKRAALGANAIENADAVESILQRNPSIVGATGGRYTSVQQMIGSNDPDIAALGVRMHNIALASNGAHGIRAAQAIAQTEEELFNHFKTGPDGIRSGLNAVRDSVKTFIDDEKNFSTTGKRVNAGGSADPLGIR